MRVVYRVHAVRRMFERGITTAEVEKVLSAGEEIAQYTDDRPYPSSLMLGWRGARPLHVVVADNTRDNERIVITVYEPDPDLWTDGFRRRKQ